MNAFEVALKKLKESSPGQIAINIGGTWDKVKNILTVFYLDTFYSIQYPEIKFLDETLKNREKILILHYLIGAKKYIKENGFIGFKDIPSGEMYYPALHSRIYKPLIKKFGDHPLNFMEKAKKLNGKPFDISEFSVRFSVFPKIHLIFILYPADEEFSADAKVLFDASISEIFDIENIVVMCEEIVIKLCS
ncbi:MAG: DUF3786 domain-containing protein [Candidatus Omnitrophica bacterium]|nr:DUF3786 domain-containing protein [Candidatus Omnitrophota bacterium]